MQVAVLFRNHSDLLTEFTYFLPDNSPPQGVSTHDTAGMILVHVQLPGTHQHVSIADQ